MKNSTLLFISFLLFTVFSFAQSFEQRIIEQYNKIEIEGQESSHLKEIEKLYEESKKMDFQNGLLRGAMLLQRENMRNNSYSLSEKYGLEAEKVAVELNNYNALATINLCRGQINMILDKYPEADAYLKISLKYAEQINNEVDKHLQLAQIYANYAGMGEGSGETDKIRSDIEKSLKHIEAISSKDLTEKQEADYYYLYINGLLSMGAYHFYIQDPPDLTLSEYYYQRVLELKNTAPKYFHQSDADIYQSISNFYIAKKDYQKAIEYSLEFLKIEKNKKDPRGRKFSYRNLKDAYHELNNLDQENKYLRLYTALNDSINQLEKKTIVSQTRNRIKEADVKKRNFIISSGLIAILLVGGALLLVQRKSKKNYKEYEQIIEKLKAKSLENSSKIEEADEIEIEEFSEAKTEEGCSKIQITDDTVNTILQRLSKFEKSNKYLKKEMSLGYLAAQLGTNTRYLSEIIKQHKSKSFNNYINGLRINYISMLLYKEPKYRKYKISYLAELCGFSSRVVFATTFKKETGVSPSYYIRNLKSNHHIE